MKVWEHIRRAARHTNPDAYTFFHVKLMHLIKTTIDLGVRTDLLLLRRYFDTTFAV